MKETEKDKFIKLIIEYRIRKINQILKYKLNHRKSNQNKNRQI